MMELINIITELKKSSDSISRKCVALRRKTRKISRQAEIIEKNISLMDSSNISTELMLAIAQKDMEQIKNLDKSIAEISKGLEKQANGIKRVSTSISQIEKATQLNVAISEQSSISSTEEKK